ncbi:MAG: YicC family protein [Myxococcaceae bacterium]|nr:YicC family protein [Myxococcaceae bacterium]MCI0671822.1 YicC family protein [Myxococcaceae bacterium]
MLRSMTGFGAGRSQVGEEDVAVELRAVNHKFCEVKARLPRELASLEAGLVKRVKERLARGAVDLTVRRVSTTATGTAPTVDLALAREYLRAYRELAQALQLPEPVGLAQIATQPGVLRLEERGVDVASAEASTSGALDAALDALVRMREREGEALRVDLEARLAQVATWVQEVEALSPRAVAVYRDRLTERVAELSRGAPVDPQRLAQEVVLFAERTDVAEEMTRLRSHLEQFRALLGSAEPSGRRMDFLVQEMHREVNTTGSKSQDPDISARVVSLKAELERIREQVQNVE